MFFADCTLKACIQFSRFPTASRQTSTRIHNWQSASQVHRSHRENVIFKGGNKKLESKMYMQCFLLVLFDTFTMFVCSGTQHAPGSSMIPSCYTLAYLKAAVIQHQRQPCAWIPECKDKQELGLIVKWQPSSQHEGRQGKGRNAWSVQWNTKHEWAKSGQRTLGQGILFHFMTY